MSHPLAGLVVLITGASSGIGAALARQCADAGARLALAARDAERLRQVADACHAKGAEAVILVGDVSQEQDCRSIVERCVAHFGRLDVLVNNAGLGSSAPFESITDLSIFETLMRVNYLGSVWCTAHALPSCGRPLAASSPFRASPD